MAFIVDVFGRRTVGWRVRRTITTDFVLDALGQALYARQLADSDALIKHSGRGSQYVSIRYAERLADAGIKPSVASRGDSYDNTLAETISRLNKAELIHRRGPWKSRESVELATLEWVSCFNHQKLMEPMVYIPLRKLRQTITGNSPVMPPWRHDLNQTASAITGAVQYLPLRLSSSAPIKDCSCWPVRKMESLHLVIDTHSSSANQFIA